MDFQNLELTPEDILDMHRYHITKLFVEGGMTVVEIVQDLYASNSFSVTITQVQRCLQDWNLLPLPSSNSSRLEASSVSGSTPQYLQNNTATGTPNCTSIPRSIPDSNYAELYINRPLPDLPPSKSRTPEPSSSTDNNYTTSRSPSQTLAKTDSPPHSIILTPSSSDNNDKSQPQTSPPSLPESSALATLPTGPSPLETYTETQHIHERLAIGLGSADGYDAGDFEGMRYERSTERAGSRVYARRERVIKLRKKKKNNEGEGRQRQMEG